MPMPQSDPLHFEKGFLAIQTAHTAVATHNHKEPSGTGKNDVGRQDEESQAGQLPSKGYE